MPGIYPEGADQMTVNVPRTVSYGMAVAAARRRLSRSQLVATVCEKWLEAEGELPRTEDIPTEEVSAR